MPNSIGGTFEGFDQVRVAVTKRADCDAGSAINIIMPVSIIKAYAFTPDKIDLLRCVSIVGVFGLGS